MEIEFIQNPKISFKFLYQKKDKNAIKKNTKLP